MSSGAYSKISIILSHFKKGSFLKGNDKHEGVDIRNYTTDFVDRGAVLRKLRGYI